MKICILTSSHPPFDTRVFTKEARTLAGAGHDVTLVVPHPRSEIVDGVRLRGIPKRTGRWQRWILGPIDVWRAARGEKAEAYHFHDPELLGIGLMLALLGSRVVYDVHEDVPRDILGKAYIPWLIRPALAALVGVAQRTCARAFSDIVVAREDIAPAFRGHPRVTVVSNYPSRTLAGPRPPERSAPVGRPLQIAYVGSMSPIRGVREMVDAVARSGGEAPVHLHLYGRFASAAFEEEIRARAARHAPGGVTIHGEIAYARVPEVLGAADIGIVCFLPEPNNINSGPTKLFEYMACALPVIASDFPEWRQVVDGAGCGVCVDPTSPESIVQGITELARDPVALVARGRRGWEATQERFNWEAEARKLLGIYRGQDR